MIVLEGVHDAHSNPRLAWNHRAGFYFLQRTAGQYQRGVGLVRVPHTMIDFDIELLKGIENQLRIYSVGVTAVVAAAIANGRRTRSNIVCVCVGREKRVPLWDEMEQCFASPEIQQRVRDLQEESAIVLSNQSKERALVGEVISTVALADQISREFNVSDQGIDMEIEFTNDVHEATGAKLYLQLKSGDSYLRERKSDGAEIFTIKDERHAHYWMAQAFPVLLVIRYSEGEVRWMRIDDYLKRESDNGKKPVKQIVFAGERFDVMSVRRWRERVLGGT
jgi:hypothetical protein